MSCIFKINSQTIYGQGQFQVFGHPVHLHTETHSDLSTVPQSKHHHILLGCIRTGFLIHFPAETIKSNNHTSPTYHCYSGYLVTLALFFRAGSFTSFCFPPTVLLSVCPPRGSIPLDNRDNSFSRSRSSSVTSIDKEAREAITSFYFSQTYTRKMDSSLSPALWVGTSLGTVLAISLSMPPPGEQRLLQPVIVSPSGKFI